MNTRRPALSPSYAFLATHLALSACATADISDYCEYSADRSTRTFDPESLALVLGTEPDETFEDPRVSFSRPSRDGVLESVAAEAIPAVHPLPADIDESRCTDVDWRTYSLEFDSEAWQEFWKPEKGKDFSLAVSFPNMAEPHQLRLDRFGFVVMDTKTTEPLVACGCYSR